VGIWSNSAGNVWYQKSAPQRRGKSEFHQVSLLGLDKFLTDKIPYYTHYFSCMQMEFAGGHIAPIMTFGQIKQGTDHAKTNQLDLIVIVFLYKTQLT